MAEFGNDSLSFELSGNFVGQNLPGVIFAMGQDNLGMISEASEPAHDTGLVSVSGIGVNGADDGINSDALSMDTNASGAID